MTNNVRACINTYVSRKQQTLNTVFYIRWFAFAWVCGIFIGMDYATASIFSKVAFYTGSIALLVLQIYSFLNQWHINKIKRLLKGEQAK